MKNVLRHDREKKNLSFLHDKYQNIAFLPSSVLTAVWFELRQVQSQRLDTVAHEY